jgi:PAS domain-containing protein
MNHTNHKKKQTIEHTHRNETNDFSMSADKPKDQVKGPAQTASIGDREMMTYMLLPSMEMEASRNTVGNDSDDGQFLDGLFDKSSTGFGSSENGSDDGCKEDGEAGGNGSNTPLSRVAAAAAGVSVNSDSLSGHLTPNTQLVNQNNRMMPAHPAGVSEISSLTSSSHLVQSSAQLPQHLITANNYSSAGINPDVLNKMPDSTGTSYLQYNHPWMMNSGLNLASAQFCQNPLNEVTSQPVSHIPSTIHGNPYDRSGTTPNTQEPNESTNHRKRKAHTTITPHQTASKQFENMSAISEDEGEMDKRRIERNMREQERSKRISSQISQLKDLLAAANVRFKPDKFNTLVSVHSYIRTLQQRQALLDEEHQKLVNTITKSNELVAKSQTGHCTNSSLEEVPETSSGQNIIPRSQTTHSVDEEILAFVRGLDYKNVFSKIQIALCVTSIDGRLLDCNDEFARVCSLSRDLLVSSGLRKPDEMDPVEKAEAGKSPLSLFNLMASRMSREDMQHVFEAMSNMLKQAHVSNDDSSESIHPDGGVKQTHSDMMKYDHWSTEIMKCQNSTQKLQLNISLVRRKGMPRFFNCALTNIEQE